MSLGFGLLSAQLRPGETDWTRAYDDTVRLAVDAETMGLASVWTTEHHFVDDGYKSRSAPEWCSHRSTIPFGLPRTPPRCSC